MSLDLMIKTILSFIYCIYAFSSIYDKDDRQDLSFYKNDFQIQNWAKSVALITKKNQLIEGFKNGKKQHFLLGETYKNYQQTIEEPLCESERFQDHKIVTPAGTGFLVGDDLMFTAGHVIENQQDCDTAVIIFDYIFSLENVNSDWFGEELVYECQEIIKTNNQILGNEILDYAVIKLNRKTEGREGLKLNFSKVENSADLLMIGHPSGLPLKVIDSGKIISNSEATTFTALLDSFPGNSGAPVFNRKNGLVEGILIESELGGTTTIEGEWPSGCWYSKVYCSKPDGPFLCDESEFSGAKITRISTVQSN